VVGRPGAAAPSPGGAGGTPDPGQAERPQAPVAAGPFQAAGRWLQSSADGHTWWLLGRGDAVYQTATGCAVRIDQSTRDGCAILAPVGELDLEAMPAFRRVLLKRLAEQPVAVICDLSGLQELDPSCAAVFTSVANHPSSSWPQTNLLVCCAQPAVSAMLERLGVPKFLAMHPTLEEALAHAGSRPPYLRAELALGPSPTAPEVARRFVDATCWQWRLQAVGDPADPLARRWGEELVDRAMLVASELVTNAVVHTHGPLRLRLALVAGRLHLAVADQSPRLLGLAADPGDPDAEAGRGLVVVDQLASAWGVHHAPEGGKEIWCVLER
jgi:anti-anti-sigma factor